jgi:hypothetical protein
MLVKKIPELINVLLKSDDMTLPLKTDPPLKNEDLI